MTGIAVGTLTAPALVGAVGPRWAFVLAGSFLPLVALASYALLRRLDAGAAVPVEVLTLLMRVPILAVLAPRIVERLARDAEPVGVSSGEVVVATGDAGSLFYVIASGRVSVSVNGEEVRELGPGGWFGEIALLHDVPRTATVTARTDLAFHEGRVVRAGLASQSAFATEIGNDRLRFTPGAKLLTGGETSVDPAPSSPSRFA